MTEKYPTYVGDVRPSQLMFTYGVGAIIDLPKLSVIVSGLDDWPTNPTYARPIIEERLLTAVRFKLPDVEKTACSAHRVGFRVAGGPVR